MRTGRPLGLGPCERGPRDTRPTLFLRDAPQASVLVMTAPGFECEVLLQPRFVRLLLLLVDAWNKDVAEPEALRGFRSPGEIGRAFQRFINGKGSVEVDTVVNYVYEIRQLIKKALIKKELAATSDGVEREPVDLFEHRPNQGYRIGRLGIKVIQPSAEDYDAASDGELDPN